MRTGNPTPDDLIAEMDAMGLRDLVQGICRDHGASLKSVLAKSEDRHVIRARHEVVFALRNIIDDVTQQHRYSFATLGILLGRDRATLKRMLDTRATGVLAFATKHRTESAIPGEKILTRGRKVLKPARPQRSASSSPEVHVWVLAGVEQTEPVDVEHPVLADKGGNLIAIGRVYQGRTYAGRRATDASTVTIPEAPASGRRAVTEAA